MASTGDPRLRLHGISVQPRSRSTMSIIPPELDDGDLNSRNVGRNLDILIHRLNRKPILQDSLRWRFLDEEGRRLEEEPEPIAMPTQTLVQPPEPTSTLESIPELSPRCDSNHPIPPLCGTFAPQVQYKYDGQVADPSSEDRAHLKSTDTKRLRRPTETRLHKSASNLRTLGLMTDMIENGVQCNVQNSTPSSPTRTSSTSSALPRSTHYTEPDGAPGSHTLPVRMELEIDMGHSEPEEDTMLNDGLALRHASSPAGIRKFGLLRYRSSAEAALSCKNMKKSVPRMRRRTRTNSTNSTTAPTSSTQTSMVV
ncbi:hypothetical protein F5Y19DRAFT_62995 [Xylariaceae sp. FL1651]|nr:hypothetical protein F5Y19DRAFT_62995 [Xylariaceae sp. FL1651]